MSLTGVRDMVAMTQPPANRHEIQTYVTEYDDTIVKDAILHEKARGGQTYFISVSYTHLKPAYKGRNRAGKENASQIFI